MRRKLDFYETNRSAVDALLARVQLGYHVLCPTAGNGAVAKVIAASSVLPTRALRSVITNDVDPQWGCDTTGDACALETEASIDVVDNVPFNEAFRIVKHFVERGHRCAFLLRMSWMEPTNERAAWLAEHPPSGLIVLPRYSYTGDGKTDSVTNAWHLWGFDMQPPIQIAPRVGPG